ncbi:hypothetical protein CDAR_383621 [Caerostris darwini]|uniref:C2H2-type domain-containing protein n=1 Tax=Caerostris darwini TaxID=1538125 RepID=A0AAV4T402_9ARAC|nr:hypothetical protein CDAR_383621 [Caerostris darwini]
MEIMKCEFCNTYIKKFEVHNCMRFANKLRRTSATLPQCSSGNVAEGIELITAEEMEDEALWPFLKQSDSSTLNQVNQSLNEINNSRQQGVSSYIHQGIDCEETAATEMASQYGDTNQNSYNPSDYETEPSESLFPDMHYIQENDLISTHLQLPPEVSNVFINQNPQNYESSNSEQPEDTAMSSLTKHVRTIHAGETPDSRRECDESCSNNSLPKCRMPKHAGEERSKCDSCGAEFSSEESLEAHQCKEDYIK